MGIVEELPMLVVAQLIRLGLDGRIHRKHHRKDNVLVGSRVDSEDNVVHDGGTVGHDGTEAEHVTASFLHLVDDALGDGLPLPDEFDGGVLVDGGDDVVHVLDDNLIKGFHDLDIVRHHACLPVGEESQRCRAREDGHDFMSGTGSGDPDGGFDVKEGIEGRGNLGVDVAHDGTDGPGLVRVAGRNNHLTLRLLVLVIDKVKVRLAEGRLLIERVAVQTSVNL